ncbi:MAG: alpha-mannosidase [Clostridiales bacterium]|nr:alpha-mannosidase [Clostridiales bacterium]
MSNLAAKFTALKTAVGGNREKTGFEFTFGMPREAQMHITPPNKTITRILAQLEFALKLNDEKKNAYHDIINSALDFLTAEIKENGVITYKAAEAAEQLLMPMAEEAKSYKLILCGHAHIDMNWMWSWQETVAATLATFRTVLNLMDEYPEFHFSQSQASVYKIVEDFDPEMMREIKKRIKEGRWEVTAAAWVETDKNMPSTTSLLDHIKYTRDYLEKNWDIDPKSLEVDFSPDTFGHSAQIPEIDTFGSVKYYYHCRACDQPYALYRMRSPSGEELLMYREQYWYNSAITPAIAAGLIDISRKCAGFKTGIIVYGVGNHGGGPTRRDIEIALSLKDYPIYPTVKFGTFREFFREAEAVRDKLPVIDRELNHIFDGCYTTQSRIKRANRGAENALYEGRYYSALSAMVSGKTKKYLPAQFEKASQQILFNHFHDILTGSCVQDTREHAMGLYQDSMAISNSAASKALRELSDKIDTSGIKVEENPDHIALSQSEGAGVGYGIEHFQGVPNPERGVGRTRIFNIFNSTATERREPVELTVWDWTGDMRNIIIEDYEGKPLPFALIDGGLQQYWDHKFFRILVDVKTPPYGYTTIVLKEKQPESYPVYLSGETTQGFISEFVLENEYIRAEFDIHDGALISLIDKETGAEMIKAGERAGLVQVDTQTNGSAWVIGTALAAHPITKLRNISGWGHGDLLRGIRFEAGVLNSTVRVNVSLAKHARALKYAIEVDWKESTGEFMPLLCYRLPYAYESDTAVCDIPGGTITRKAANHDIACQTYIAAKSADDSGRCVGLSVDSKYGYRMYGGSLYSTLIHTPAYPDPYPERAIHKINLYVTVGSDCPKVLQEQTMAFYRPLRFIPTSAHKGALKPEGTLFGVSASTAVITSVDTSDDGRLLIRVGEYTGNDTDIKLTFAKTPKSASLVNLMQEELSALKPSRGAVSFKLPKWKIAQVHVEF